MNEIMNKFLLVEDKFMPEMHLKQLALLKKSRFIKEQEAKGLLSNLRIKTPLSKVPLLNVLF